MTGLLAVMALAVSSARAENIYLNGTRVDGVGAYEFKDVDVKIDSEGNVWIDAPQYRVEARQTADTENPIPQHTYWLVTEDAASTGHELNVTINGMPVQVVRSGDQSVTLDIAGYLRKGVNTVVVQSVGHGDAQSGTLSVYVGRGTNTDGTVSMRSRDVVFSRKVGDPSGHSESFSFSVQ